MDDRHVCYFESEDGEKAVVLGKYSVGEEVSLDDGKNECTFTEDVPADMKEKGLPKSFIPWRAAGAEDEWEARKQQFSP